MRHCKSCKRAVPDTEGLTAKQPLIAEGICYRCVRKAMQIVKAPMGRPKKLDDKLVRRQREKGKSLAEIAKLFGVTRGAIQQSLKRSV